jgi:hypothetical protein
MNEILIILRNENYIVDSLFYKKNNINYKIIPDPDAYQNLIISDELSQYNNITVIIDDMMFDSIAKTGNPFDTSKHTNHELLKNNDEIFFKNMDIFSKKLNNDTKIILYDNIPELNYPDAPIKKYINQWLAMNSNNYFISLKSPNVIHPRAITNLTYLPLIYTYFKLNFNKHPKLDYARPSHTDYDFITFLGLNSKTEKIQSRLDFLKSILKNNLNKLKHEKDSNDYVNHDNFGINTLTSNHFANLIQSLSVKVQLIFETFNPLAKFHEDYYFSEKTMKLFLLPHPYFLLMHGSALIELEKLGFKFPIKCFTLDDFENNINTILNDIDEWVDKYSDSFYHNQTHFYNLANSDTLPHHLFIKSILLK